MELRPILNAEPEREIVVDAYGSFLGLTSERLVIKKQGTTEREIPLFGIEQITVASKGISLSSDLIEACMDRGIRINFINFSGRPYAMIHSPTLTGTVMTRREQIAAYADHRGVRYCRLLVRGKVKNQINTLKYFGKYRKGTNADVYRALQDRVSRMMEIVAAVDDVDGKTCDDVRPQLMSIEGRVADQYWQGVRQLLGEEAFQGRERRGADDPVNSMLNYGYGMLYSKIWGAVLLAGLEPFAGFMHVDRPGKPSLVLDVIEEFRQAVVDRTVLGLLGKGTTVQIDDEGKMDDTSRRLVVRKVNERLDALEGYEGKKHRVRSIIQMQARHLATYMRGERPYEPFVATW